MAINIFQGILAVICCSLAIKEFLNDKGELSNVVGFTMLAIYNYIAAFIDGI